MTTDCCTDLQKLVRWSIVFLKPGGPRSFPGWEGREELVSPCLSRSDFEAEKVAEFIRAHPRIPAVDGRFVRVYSEVLRCYEKPAWDFEEAQIGVLEQIRDALQGDHRKHRVRLPKTMRLAGALNSEKSEFGDEFVNMPEFMGAHPKPGHTFLSGWVEVAFQEPKGNTAEFTLNWFGVGTPVVITFGGGQQFDFTRTKTFPLPFLPDFTPVQTRGTLDLVTGKVLPESVQIFATFQGTTIGRTDRVNRIPYAFPYIFPPLDPSKLQINIPPDYRPPVPMPAVFGNIELSLDFDGNITGFELHSETFAPVGLFPYIQNFFPPFSFGPKNQFHFANPDRCLAGTPPQSCPNEEDNPDGILTSSSVYFHPHLDLVADEMAEASPAQASPAPAPASFANAVLVEAGGRLYRIGGTGGSGTTGQVDVYDPDSNQWSAGPKLPYAVESAQGAAVGGRIYVFGGWPGADQPPAAYVQVLDIAAGKWKVLDKAPLPVPVAEGTAAAVDEKIYVISGWRSKSGKNELSAAVQIFDTRHETWSQGASAALPAAGACAIASDDEILVVGGRISGKTLTRRTAVYDVRSNQWSTGPDTLEPVYQAAGGLIEGRIFLVGGRSKVDGPTLPVTQELVLRQDEWRPGLPPPLAVADAGGAALDGALYIVGGRAAGEKGAGSLSQAVQVLRPARGWASGGQLPLYTSGGVISLGGMQGRPQSPGALTLLLGADLTGADPSQTSITVGGLAAKVVAATPQAVFFEMPQNLDTAKGRAELRLTRSGVPVQAPPIEIPVAPVTPGLFEFDFGEPVEPAYLLHAPGMACNEDGTLNFASQPARPGELLGLWATGLGRDPDKLGDELQAEVGGKPAQVEKISPAPIPIPGVYVVQVRVAASAQLASNSPATLTYKSFTSNPVGVAVRQEGWRLNPPVPCDYPLALGAVFPFLLPPPG